jgi:hypothetical protein
LSFIQTEWADLHHSRVQEWTALGVVAGIHFGLAQAADFAEAKLPGVAPAMVVLVASLLGGAFAVLGILITLRHRHLMNVKLRWIYEAEDRLGLVKHKDNPAGILPKDDVMAMPRRWVGLSAPRPLSTGGLMIGFYALLLLLDLLVAGWAALV